MTEISTDICVIGAGSGGLSVAAGAVQMGAQVVLIEGHEMGGDCLNTGCVPSKALIAAAKHARAHLTGAAFGVAPSAPQIDFPAVMAHVKGVIADIAPHDSVERFEGLGVKVITARGKFTGPQTVEAGGQRITARRFVIATGSRAAIPPIPGLSDTPFLTNETVWDLTERPGHLLILGAGPIGAELGQAFRRLGSDVTIVDMAQLLPREDPDLAQPVRAAFLAEDITLIEKAGVEHVSGTPGAISLKVRIGTETRVIEGTHLLVATGRRPNVEDLGLEAAGVAYSPQGVQVGPDLVTTNPRILAIGDVASVLKFTHVAGWQAGVAIRRLLFKLPAKAIPTAIPRATYTDPEVAAVGMTAAEAAAAGIQHQVLTWPLKENDRAHAERITSGLIKVIVGRGGKILGAGICGPGAGELIHPWTLAIANNLKIGAMASAVASYPTLSEVSKRVAGSYFTPSLYSAKVRFLVRLLMRFS